MSLAGLLSQQVTIVSPAQTPMGWDFGVAASRTATAGRLEQRSTLEETVGYPAAGPDTAETQWLLFLGPGVTVGAADHVEVVQPDGSTAVFEVVGTPAVVFGARSAHHIEATLRQAAAAQA